MKVARLVAAGLLFITAFPSSARAQDSSSAGPRFQIFRYASRSALGALTSQPQRASFPLNMALRSTALPRPSWLKISQVRTLSVERIGKKLARLSAEDLNVALEGLNEIIGG